jgi:hypothetical protein
MINKQMFVCDSAAPNVGEKLLILFVLANDCSVGSKDASPEGAKHLSLSAFLRIGFTDDRALQVQKLPIY